MLYDNGWTLCLDCAWEHSDDTPPTRGGTTVKNRRSYKGMLGLLLIIAGIVSVANGILDRAEDA